ncbi:unnamed protein product [Choristocarpus tenellus]
MAGGTAMFSFLMHVMNEFKLKKDKHSDALLEAIKSRPPGQSLITVSNHCSPLDDPAVFIAMLPASVTLRPSLVRWTLCAQEICFKKSAHETLFGAAKVMPIARGQGVDQRMLLNFHRRSAAGGWCHIFPEGKCVQTGSLGGRRPGPSREKYGRLKWGVGKLIAHSSSPPTVIPIFHTGMSNVVPLHPSTRKIIHTVPRAGHCITARVGPALVFDDLIEEHVRVHGALHKLSMPLEGTSERCMAEGGNRSRSNKNSNGGGLVQVGGNCHGGGDDFGVNIGDVFWKSSAAERRLYGAITSRVELALLNLEHEARLELGSEYPGIPPEVALLGTNVSHLIDPKGAIMYLMEYLLSTRQRLMNFFKLILLILHSVRLLQSSVGKRT